MFLFYAVITTVFFLFKTTNFQVQNELATLLWKKEERTAGSTAASGNKESAKIWKKTGKCIKKTD